MTKPNNQKVGNKGLSAQCDPHGLEYRACLHMHQHRLHSRQMQTFIHSSNSRYACRFRPMC